MGVAESRVAVWLLAFPLACAAAVRDGFNLSEPAPGVFVHIGRPLPLDAPQDILPGVLRQYDIPDLVQVLGSSVTVH